MGLTWTFSGLLGPACQASGGGDSAHHQGTPVVPAPDFQALLRAPSILQVEAPSQMKGKQAEHRGPALFSASSGHHRSHLGGDLCILVSVLGNPQSFLMSWSAAFVPENGNQRHNCICPVALPAWQLLSVVCSKSILRFEFGGFTFLFGGFYI